MSIFKKHRLVILQFLTICGALITIQFLAQLLPKNIWGFMANFSLMLIWIFLFAILITFLTLQIIQNFLFERSFLPSKLRIKALPTLKNYQIINPLEREGNFYKTQLHTHSNLSYDSKVPPPQIIESYKNSGYDILAITDHDKLSDFSNLSTPDMLILPGIEETVPVLFWPIPLGKHLVLINPQEKRPHSKTVQERFDQAAHSDGLAIPAHLNWRGGAGTGRWYLHELYRLKNLQFIEIDNPHSKDPFDLTMWHKLIIHSGPEHPIWGVAVDDSHSGSSHSGWIMIKAPQLDLPSVIASLKKGAFYATTGPSNLEIIVAGTQVHVHSPGAIWIRFINAQNQVIMATRSQEAVYQSCGDEGFIRVEVANKDQQTAWSQPMWLMAKGEIKTKVRCKLLKPSLLFRYHKRFLKRITKK
jgi:hypothetical protein